MVQGRKGSKVGVISSNRWEMGSSTQVEGLAFTRAQNIRPKQGQQTIGCRPNPAITVFVWCPLEQSCGGDVSFLLCFHSLPPWLLAATQQLPRAWAGHHLHPEDFANGHCWAMKSQSRSCSASGHLPRLIRQHFPGGNNTVWSMCHQGRVKLTMVSPAQPVSPNHCRADLGGNVTS